MGDAVTTVTDSHAGFALALHRAMTPSADTSAVCSPWSVASALAAVSAGADVPARDEIAAALDLDPDALRELAAQASALVRGREPDDDSALAVANTLWVDEASTPTPRFTTALSGWPGAAVRRASLAQDPERARRTVNADVAETTRGLVPEVLRAGSVTSDDRAVLVNALYLREAWVEPFEVGRTADAPFQAPGGTLTVPTMRAAPEAPYTHQDGWAYASLPLQHGLRAELLVPDGPLADTEPGLDGSAVERLRSAASDHRLALYLPRVSVEGGGAMADPLHRLGVSRLFDASATPLPHVLERETLALSAAHHRAVLRVDERGVEGAASTALVMKPVMFRELPEAELRVDRPFLVLLTHRATGAVLFCARVVSP